jgi:hypothetical protein
MITFENLWNNHPSIKGNSNPCNQNGKKNFTNQCAIRVGVSLEMCGFDTKKLPGATHCWHGHKNEGHVIRAEEMANGLSRIRVPGLKQLIKVDPKNLTTELSGKKGIIFFKDYWRRTNKTTKFTESFRNRSGDHIDIWNGRRTTDPTSWARLNLRIGGFGLHTLSSEFSDFEDSREIWFWETFK